MLEDGRDTPVPGALVSLLDREGERRAEALSGVDGRFVLAPPDAGEYVVEAVRLGYEPTRSPLFAMKTEGSVPFDILMTPEPLGLPGLEVTVEAEAEELLRNFGASPVTLGNRWIDREKIEHMVTPGMAKDVIRWQGIAGVTVVEYDDSPLGGPLCVVFSRRDRQCALTVLNGAVVLPEIAGAHRHAGHRGHRAPRARGRHHLLRHAGRRGRRVDLDAVRGEGVAGIERARGSPRS